MMQKRSLELLVLLNVISSISSGPLQRWNFELLEINTYSFDRSLIDFNAEVVRLGRGKFGFNGYWNSSIDLNDDVLVRVTFERSFHRDGPYHMMVFGIQNETLSNAMNKYYKPLVQSSAEKCCINHPIVKNKFVPPLTKRYVKLEKCSLDTDNMPNFMPTGYQRLRVTLFCPFEVYVESISYIENKVF